MSPGCLWSDGNAEEAARFYADTFPDTRINAIHYAPGNYPSGKEGDPLTVQMTILDMPFLFLNGWPNFTDLLAQGGEPAARAFLDADAMAKWLPPHGFTCKVQHMYAKAGGTFKMSFTNFATGKGHSFGGTYLELVPSAKIVYTDSFDDPNLPGEMITTVTIRPVIGGAELNVVQEGIPEMIPVEMCYLGWQQSLVLLAHLVEPEIADG